VYRPAAPRQRKSKLVTASGAEDGTMQP
jgi:hypothetical protein